MLSGLDSVIAAHRQASPIYVVRPTLPPLEEYRAALERVWQRCWLANDGVCHQDLERKMSEYLGVEHLSLVSSGTMALLLMLHALRITSGEVITTPFTFPATTHVLHWNGVTPVFCDVDPNTGNIDPNRLAGLITPKTRAILGVHIYGTPCDTEVIQAIADRYGLSVLYDAAHAFGSRIGGKSLCSFGDMSALSFHATKLFSTCEGGAVVCKTAAQKERISYLKNFGIADEETVIGPGINGKMNELSAAYGLLQLDMVDREIARRAALEKTYELALDGIPGIARMKRSATLEHNHAYLPILVTDEYGLSRDTVHDAFKACNIFTRKYFYPLASHYSCYASLPSAAPDHLPVAERLARQVLCLPMYGTVPADIPRVVGSLLRELPEAARKVARRRVVEEPTRLH